MTSPANPWLKSVRRAVANGELTRDGLCVCEGFHLLEEALRCGRQVVAVFLSGESARERAEPLLGSLAAVRIFSVPEPVFETLTSTETTQGVVSLITPPVWTLEQVTAATGPVAVLDGIQDPGNAGAIVRVAEAFGAAGVVFLKGTTGPFNPKNLRASAGSVFRVPFIHDVRDRDLLACLQEKRIAMLAAMPGGDVAIDHAALGERCAIIFGNEGRGVRPELARHATPIRIPTSGVESLNAAVAAGVILYEAWRQRTSA